MATSAVSVPSTTEALAVNVRLLSSLDVMVMSESEAVHKVVVHDSVVEY